MIDDYEALFNKNYLRWFHLEGKPSLVEIVSVKDGVPMTLPGGVKTKNPVLELKLISGEIKDMKPLVLNQTNGHRIALIHGRKPSGWPGKEIVLYQDETEMYDKELRKMKIVPCIRVRERKKEVENDRTANA